MRITRLHAIVWTTELAVAIYTLVYKYVLKSILHAQMTQ